MTAGIVSSTSGVEPTAVLRRPSGPFQVQCHLMTQGGGLKKGATEKKEKEIKEKEKEREGDKGEGERRRKRRRREKEIK